MDDIQFLANLTVSQFKVFKRMINTLCRLGVNRELAVTMIIGVMRDNNRYVTPRMVNAKY